MKINYIKLENHKVLGNFEFDFRAEDKVRSFSLLVGENGCGKTIFLELIHDILQSGIRLWNDGVNRKISITFTDKEKRNLNLSLNTLIFEENASYAVDPNWNRVKIFDESENDITTQYVADLQRGGESLINKSLKCAYTPVEINFSTRPINAITASSTDSEEIPKSRASNDLATEIAQLLVDIDAQDNAHTAKWHRENIGAKVVELPCKLNRFKKAYENMFVGKKLSKIEPQDNQHKIIFRDTIKKVDFNISELSSGEKQVVYRAGYLLKNLSNLYGGVVLIDEPELSLHPKWQEKYLDFLRDIFTDETGVMSIQFIIATHSPLLLKGAVESDVAVFTFNKENNGGITIKNIHDMGFGRLTWSPTWGEICHDAYNMYTPEFHNDLYAMLQVKTKLSSVNRIENWFIRNGHNKNMVNWKVDNDTEKIENETLMTCIRNKMHHNDNQRRPKFNQKKLEKSIKIMIQILDDITTS